MEKMSSNTVRGEASPQGGERGDRETEERSGSFPNIKGEENFKTVKFFRGDILEDMD